MKLHTIDIGIIIVYMISMIVIGVMLARRAAKNMDSYFLGENSMPWYVLGISNASAMFDVTGTMWLVTNLFVYGLKGIWLPWLWPTFNQIFLMIYLSTWIRRSNVLTGAEWISTRFGFGRGAELSRIVIVLFALVSVVGFLGYSFKGMGKFASVFLPWHLSPDQYALIIMAVTAIYVIAGGMFSVVVTDVTQFTILTVCCFVITYIAMTQVPIASLNSMVPAGWGNIGFGWRMDIDWGKLIPAINETVKSDGYSLFGMFFSMMLFKGVLVSIAGPAPNYDMQRVLASRTPREASLMSGIVSICLVPRWLMITSITVIGIVFMSNQFVQDGLAGNKVDFEQILPFVINNWLPAGLVGLLLAGLLAAFMANFSATLNAGSAYVVNDLYKRYIEPNATHKKLLMVSYISPVIILALGVGAGFIIPSINDITQWITNGLFGGYTAANVLKWYWYRLNGYGYFWGMLLGIASALAMPALFPNLHPLWGFPFILAISLAGCILGSLLTEPEDDEVLMKFYKQVRPWGMWGPILKKVLAEDPSFQRNKNFFRDMFNVAVGIAWQMALVTAPIYAVLRNWTGMWVSIVIVVVGTLILKFNWYDKMEEDEKVAQKQAVEPVA